MTGSRLSLPRNSVASIKSTIKNVARFRWLIFAVGHLANFANSVIGISLSLTIVAMIKHKVEGGQGHSGLENITTLTNENSSDVSMKPIPTLYSSLWFTPSPDDDNFYVNWSNTDKDRMLQASFWGVLVISPFGGRLCELFGPRRILTIALMFTGISNLFFPVVARKSYYAAYLLRIFQGMVNSVNGPSTNVVVTRWSTSGERTLSNAVVTSGGALGCLVGLPLAGLLVSGTFLGGWPSVFYILGSLNIIVSIIWYFIMYDTPEEHPYLSPEELEEILSKRSLKSGEVVQVPWRKMFTSLPVYGYLVPTFTYGWIVAVVASQIPSFYEEVLGFSHEANGFMASLPWLMSMGSSLIASSIVDKVRATKRFSLTIIRKVVTLLSLGCVSVGLIAITILGNHRIAVVLTLGLSKGMATANVAGSGSTHLDTAPTFSGTLAGFSSMVSSIASLAANEGVARIVGNEPTAANWYRFFYISAAINAFGIIFFFLFGSGETQDWDPSSARRQSVKSVISDVHKSSIRSEIGSQFHQQQSTISDTIQPQLTNHPNITNEPNSNQE